MFTRNDLFRVELEKLIEDEVQRLMENVVVGHATIDFSAYKHQVGLIEGLRIALELCDAAQTSVDKKM